MPRRYLLPAFFATVAYASPAAAQSTVTVAPYAGHPTQAVTVSGAKFADSEAVDIYLDTIDTLLVVSSSTGTLSASLTIPAAALPGTHYVTAIGRHSGDAAQTKLTISTPWQQPGFGAAALNWNPYENVIGPGNIASVGLLWNAVNSNATGATPAVSGGRVFVATRAGLQALFAASGAVLWTAAPTVEFDSSPAVSGNSVYIGATTPNMYAFNATNGAILWNTTLGGGTTSSPVVASGIVYVGCNDNKLYALNASTGKLVWTYATGSSIQYSAPAISGGVVYVGSDDDYLYAVNAATGGLLWRYETGSQIYGSPSVANGIVYAISGDSKIYALRTVGSPLSGISVGSLLWSNSNAGNPFQTQAVAQNKVFYGSNKLYAANSRSGATLWSFTPDAGLNGRILVANGIVYATSNSGLTYALDENTGAEFGHAQTGRPNLGGPSISDGVLYLSGYGTGTVAYAPLAGANSIPRSAPALASLRPDMTLTANP